MVLFCSQLIKREAAKRGKIRPGDFVIKLKNVTVDFRFGADSYVSEFFIILEYDNNSRAQPCIQKNRTLVRR